VTVISRVSLISRPLAAREGTQVATLRVASLGLG
jgi:hypothetical protein